MKQQKNPTPDFLPQPKKSNRYEKSKKQKGCNPAKAFFFSFTFNRGPAWRMQHLPISDIAHQQ